MFLLRAQENLKKKSPLLTFVHEFPLRKNTWSPNRYKVTDHITGKTHAFDLVQTCFKPQVSSQLKNCQIELEIRTDKSIKSVRQTVNEMSIGNCTSQCITNRCGCRKTNLLCYSRCHG
ncbi:hypothetical protein BpHYR1_012408 [Brachionus plicatilis]|uniref:KRAB-A domain-containing 2-like n=1 Tax=Brachionus plicatilis TaxID=10195 RepID=A0A3M7SHF6_BRAPC|nr:hypothetical protein BpHYR1_012408 [Brachionus plicatilis]